MTATVIRVEGRSLRQTQIAVPHDMRAVQQSGFGLLMLNYFVNQDIKPKRELRRFAPQFSFGFWVCPNINGYSYPERDDIFVLLLSCHPRIKSAALRAALLILEI